MAAKLAEPSQPEIKVVDYQPEKQSKSVSDGPPGHGDGDSAGKKTSQTNQNNPQPSLSVCTFYMRGRCTRRKCKFDHPELCYKFKRFGNQRGGCNLGSKCSRAHVRFCRLSYTGQICQDKSKCRSVYHLKGTKSSKNGNPSHPELGAGNIHRNQNESNETPVHGSFLEIASQLERRMGTMEEMFTKTLNQIAQMVQTTNMGKPPRQQVPQVFFPSQAGIPQQAFQHI